MKPQLSSAESFALSAFTDRIRTAFGDDLVELRLFGSKARADAGPEADLDVLVVVSRLNRWPAAKVVSDIAFDVNLEHEVFISPIVLTATMVAEPGWRDSPLLVAINAEGVRL